MDENIEAPMKLYMMIWQACLQNNEYDNAILYLKKYLTIAQESGDKEAEMNAYETLGAVLCGKKNEYDDAIKYSKKCLSIAQETGNNVATMNAYATLGNAHLKKKEYDDAISYSKKCVSIAEECGDKQAKKMAYNILSEAHLMKKEYDDATLYSEKYLVVAQESGDKNAEIKAYSMLGIAHSKKKEYDDGISYSKKSVSIAQECGDKESEMTGYFVLFQAHLEKEEYGDAILYSKKWLTIAQECGDKNAEMTAYKELGTVQLMKEEYDDAILYSEKYLVVAQESDDKKDEMNAYLILTTAHLKKEEYDDAISYRKKCVSIAQESGDKEAEMNGYMTLGAVLCGKKNEYDDAIIYSKRCLSIAQETGNNVATMNAYATLGTAHLKKEEYDDAISYSKKCVSIAEECGDKEAEKVAYDNLCKAHLMKKEYDDATLYSEKYLVVAQESGDKSAEIKAYSTLGIAHSKKKEYDDGISYSKKSVSIAQECGDKESEMAGYFVLFQAHLEQEEYDDAILYIKKWLTIAQECGDKKAEMTAYKKLGSVQLMKEEYDDAHSCLTEGIKIAKALKNKDEILSFNSYFCMIQDAVGISEEYGESVMSALRLHREMLENRIQEDDSVTQNYILYTVHREGHEYKKAILCLQEAMVAPTQEHGGTQSLPFLWLFNYLISEMYLLLGEHDEAMLYQQEALGIACENGRKNQQARSHFILGKGYYEVHQLDEAEKSLRESLECYELLFGGLKENDRFKIAFVDKYKETYKILLKVLIETNKKEEALALSEHYRARSLKDILVSSYRIKKEQIDMDGLQYAGIQSLVFRSNYTLLFYSTCSEKLCTFLVESGNDLGFSVQNFEYCDSCLDKLVGEAFEEMKVRQVVNCADRSLDVMDDSEENKNRQEDELTQLLTRQKEKRLSEQCRSICECRGEPSENTDESSLTNGLEILYHKLIQNIKCLIKQDEIVIIPEGPLCKLPFAALRDPDTGQYLSETMRIRMAPSIATLKLLQEYPEEHYSKKKPLIVGDPLVGKVLFDAEEKEFEELEGARSEAADLAVMLGEPPLLLKQATKPAVIKRLQDGASIVHIAAHGDLKKATIVLAPSPEVLREKNIPDEEDYMLTMADVQQAQVRAQLVVLSCCYSGRGRIKAEGVIGMCRAFLASGARAVVGSLWNVDDEATFEFMVKFYEYLKEGKSASTSLHLAMNDVRTTPQYSKPKYWAPFFLMGDDVTIKFDD